MNNTEAINKIKENIQDETKQKIEAIEVTDDTHTNGRWTIVTTKSKAQEAMEIINNIGTQNDTTRQQRTEPKRNIQTIIVLPIQANQQEENRHLQLNNTKEQEQNTTQAATISPTNNVNHNTRSERQISTTLKGLRRGKNSNKPRVTGRKEQLGKINEEKQNGKNDPSQLTKTGTKFIQIKLTDLAKNTTLLPSYTQSEIESIGKTMETMNATNTNNTQEMDTTDDYEHYQPEYIDNIYKHIDNTTQALGAQISCLEDEFQAYIKSINSILVSLQAELKIISARLEQTSSAKEVNDNTLDTTKFLQDITTTTKNQNNSIDKLHQKLTTLSKRLDTHMTDTENYKGSIKNSLRLIVTAKQTKEHNSVPTKPKETNTSTTNTSKRSNSELRTTTNQINIPEMSPTSPPPKKSTIMATPDTFKSTEYENKMDWHTPLKPQALGYKLTNDTQTNNNTKTNGGNTSNVTSKDQ